MSRKKLLKKIDLHGICLSHLACEQIAQKSAEGAVQSAIRKASAIWEEINRDKLESTSRVVNTAYTCVVEGLPFTKHPKIIDLMEKNGFPHGSMLFSDHACADIIEHISAAIKTELITYLKTGDLPFSVVLTNPPACPIIIYQDCCRRRTL